MNEPPAGTEAPTAGRPATVNGADGAVTAPIVSGLVPMLVTWMFWVEVRPTGSSVNCPVDGLPPRPARVPFPVAGNDTRPESGVTGTVPPALPGPPRADHHVIAADPPC